MVAPTYSTNPLAKTGGMGPIYQYGAAMPYGPYSTLGRAGGTGGSTGSSSGSSSSESGKTPEARTYLNQVISGEKLPYSPDRVNRLKSEAGDVNAAAESSLANRMASQAAVGGVSANDPSFQGGLMNLQARRQTANQTSSRGIDETAEGANFDAQMRAASMLEQSRMQSEALAAQVSSKAMGYMPWSGGGGGSSSGGNNFTGGTGIAEYQNARLGDFKEPADSGPQPMSLTERNRQAREQAYRTRLADEAYAASGAGAYPVADDGYYEYQ